ncbi:hypothetical protein ACFLY7_01395 [Patescibacteria group bacterium]
MRIAMSSEQERLHIVNGVFKPNLEDTEFLLFSKDGECEKVIIDNVRWEVREHFEQLTVKKYVQDRIFIGKKKPLFLF